MISPITIYSVLGNPKSLVPLAVKDGANCIGQTASSYVTGKNSEAQDRFIDEVGTEAIWIGAIPAFKKIIDKTLFKFTKFDSKYDIRNLENKEIFEKTKQYAPTKKIAENIDKIGKNAKTFKNLNFIKFATATSLALLSYDALTDLKQKYTDKKIEKKLKNLIAQEENNSKKNNNNFIKKSNNNPTFSSLKKNNNISFKGGMSDFILNPVKNMYLLDGGITAQRLTKSRDSQEFIGYTIKEAGFLYFMYIAGQKIQDKFANYTDKHFNKSIALDLRALESEELKESFKTGSIEKTLNDFPKYTTEIPEKKNFSQNVKEFFNPKPKSKKILAEEVKIYDFINQNPENEIVKIAKKSDIIETYKEPQKGIFGFFKKKIDTGKIDTRKYISMDSLKETHANVAKLYQQFKNSGEDIETFFKKTKDLKRKSIKLNINSSIAALSILIPSIMLTKRIISGDKEFATETRIKNRLLNEQKQLKA